MTIKALVIEDNISLNNSIVNMLKKEGYTAFGVFNLNDGKEIFLVEKPHIILLDIMLPNGSGMDIISFFRNERDCRILMLTAINEVESKRIAYEKGADDYITKPFDLYELIYKLGAVKRRIISDLIECEVGDIVFNVDSKTLSCGDKTLNIQPSQIKLLKKLYEKYEEKTYLSKEEITDWLDKDIDIDRSCRIQTLVARLRKNLVDIASEQIIIETIYGRGYKLVVING